MPRAGLNDCKLCLQAGTGKLARHAACRLERLAEWLFHSNDLQRSHIPARKHSLRAFEPARRMRRKPPVLTPHNRAICPVADSHYR